MSNDWTWLRQPIGETDGPWRAEGPTVVAQSGRTIRFGPAQFKHQICLNSKNCFLCGLPENEAAGRKFTKEHVIPDWVLDTFGLRRRTVFQPDGTETKYGGYTIECCEPCNQLLNTQLESDLSKIFHGGYRAVANTLVEEGESFERKLFVWLSLIYTKKYLKDARLPRHHDSRKGTQTKAEALGHVWEEFHSIYDIARSPLTGADIDRSALGTLLVLPVDSTEQVEAYDYLDYRDLKIILIRLGDVALLAVLNDAKAVSSKLMKIASATKRPHTQRGLLELFGHAIYWNTLRRYRPDFRGEPDLRQRTYRISARPPLPAFRRADESMLQVIMDEIREVSRDRRGYAQRSTERLEQFDKLPDDSPTVTPPPLAPEDDPRHPVVVIRHGQDGLPIDAPPCALLGPGALNEDEAVQLVKDEGFAVLLDPIAPPIPAAELSHRYSRSRDAIAVRVFDEPKFIYARGDHPDMPFDVIVNLDPRHETAQGRGRHKKH